MPLQITGTVTGDDAVNAGFDKLGQSMEHWEKPLEKAGDKIAETTRQRFLTGQGVDGAFDALAESTIEASPERKGGPLLSLGDLMEAASANEAGVLGSLFSLSADELSQGVSSETFPGALALQFGYHYDTHDLAARTFLGLSESDEQVAVRLVDEHLGDILVRSF